VVDGGEVRRLVATASTRRPRLLRIALDSASGTEAPSTATALVDLGAGAPASDLLAAAAVWLGLDLDPAPALAVLGRHAVLGPLLARRPGLAIPGTVDGGELALRTVLGQQVSVAAARTLTARLVARLGDEGPEGLRRFPAPASILGAGTGLLRSIGLTGSRAATVVHLAGALDAGLDLSPGADPAAAREELGALPGIGPWTVEYVALRALRDMDAFPAHDLVLRQALGGVDARQALRIAEEWRPWRGLAAQHLWRASALR